MRHFKSSLLLGSLTAGALTLGSLASAADADSVRVVLNGSGPFQFELIKDPNAAGGLAIYDKKTNKPVQTLTLTDDPGALFGTGRYANLPAGEYRFEFRPDANAGMKAYLDFNDVGRFLAATNPARIQGPIPNDNPKVNVLQADTASDTNIQHGKKGLFSSATDMVTVTYSGGADLTPNTVRIVNQGKTKFMIAFNNVKGDATEVTYTTWDPSGKKSSDADDEKISTSSFDKEKPLKMFPGTMDITFKTGEIANVTFMFDTPDGKSYFRIPYLLGAEGTGIRCTDTTEKVPLNDRPVFSRIGVHMRPNTATFNCD